MSFSLPSPSSLPKLPIMLTMMMMMMMVVVVVVMVMMMTMTMTMTMMMMMMMMMMMINYDDDESDVWHYKGTLACELLMKVFFFIRAQEKTKPKRNQNEAIQQTSKS